MVVRSCISNQGSASCWGPGIYIRTQGQHPRWGGGGGGEGRWGKEGGGRKGGGRKVGGGSLGAASVIRSQHPAGVWRSTSAIKTTTPVGI